VLRTWIVLAVAAGVAIAATVDGVLNGAATAAKAPPKHRTREGDQLVGPDVPAAGGLPGTLVLTSGTNCRIETIVFAGPQISKPGARTACRVWASPSGRYAVVSTSESPGGSDAVDLSLIRLDDPSKVARQLGTAIGEPSWAPSGNMLTFCTPKGFSLTENLVLGNTAQSPGCRPRYTADGHLLTVPPGDRPDVLLRDGDVLLSTTELARGLPDADLAAIEVLDYGERADGILAVTVAQEASGVGTAALELWRNRKLLGSFLLRGGAGPYGAPPGNLVRFSPDGQELAVGSQTPEGDDPVTFFDLRLRTVSLQLDTQNGFAWSPDSAWLAVARGDNVAFYSRASGDPVYRLPVVAESLGWAPRASG